MYNWRENKEGEKIIKWEGKIGFFGIACGGISLTSLEHKGHAEITKNNSKKRFLSPCNDIKS